MLPGARARGGARAGRSKPPRTLARLNADPSPLAAPPHCRRFLRWCCFVVCCRGSCDAKRKKQDVQVLLFGTRMTVVKVRRHRPPCCARPWAGRPDSLLPACARPRASCDACQA